MPRMMYPYQPEPTPENPLRLDHAYQLDLRKKMQKSMPPEVAFSEPVEMLLDTYMDCLYAASKSKPEINMWKPRERRYL